MTSRFTAVSRAPLAKLPAFRERMGWTFPWASSGGGDFNFDFTSPSPRSNSATVIEYNYRRGHTLLRRVAHRSGLRAMPRYCGTDSGDPFSPRERPGMSAFVIEDDTVYHTYSTYSRGLDGLWGSYQWLDRAPKGRNEQGIWWRRHDRVRP